MECFMNMSVADTLPLVSKFMPYATIEQGTKVNDLMRGGNYTFNRFMLNGETHSAVAVLECDAHLVIVYPDGYLDLRRDRSIEIIKDF
jgi:hypothetical protein